MACSLPLTLLSCLFLQLSDAGLELEWWHVVGLTPGLWLTRCGVSLTLWQLILTRLMSSALSPVSSCSPWSVVRPSGARSNNACELASFAMIARADNSDCNNALIVNINQIHPSPLCPWPWLIWYFPPNYFCVISIYSDGDKFSLIAKMGNHSCL